MVRVRELGVFFVYFICTASSYNFDTSAPIWRTASEKSEFGYSIASYRMTEDSDYNADKLLEWALIKFEDVIKQMDESGSYKMHICVGAPKTDYPGDSIDNSGVVYCCDFQKYDPDISNCKLLYHPIVDVTRPRYTEHYQHSADDGRFGSTVQSNLRVLKVCSPYVKSWRGKPAFYSYTGACVEFLPNGKPDPKHFTELCGAYDASLNKEEFKHIPFSQWSCQYGFACDLPMTFNRDYVCGSPSAYNWAGQIQGQIALHEFDEKPQLVASAEFCRIYNSSTCIVNTQNRINRYSHAHKLGYDSYLGFSVAVARFGTIYEKEDDEFQNDTKAEGYTVVAGAPRGSDTGAIIVFKLYSFDEDEAFNFHSFENFKLGAKQPIYGEHIGSGYGSSILAIDIDGDRYDEIVVGAPFYHLNERSGAFYVYQSNDADRSQKNYRDVYLKEKPTQKIEGPARRDCEELFCPEAQFATSFAKIGDINKDGYNDMVVGAPFYGKGAVFIYLGTQSRKFQKEPAQIITAESLGIDALASGSFGYNVGDNDFDIDGNGYPDIAVGAPFSDTTVVLRGRPIVQLNTQFQDVPSLISLTVAGCQVLPCFSYKVCFTASNVRSLTSNSEFSFVLSIDSDQNLKRTSVSLPGASLLNVNDSGIEALIKLSTDGNRKCQEVRVQLKEVRQLTQAVELSHMWYVKEGQKSKPQIGASLHSLDDQPVLQKADDTKLLQVKFDTECTDDVCDSDLSVELVVEADLAPSPGNGVRSYLIKGDKAGEVNFSIRVRNNGPDPTYDTVVSMPLGSLAQFVGSTSCRVVNSTLFCGVKTDSNTWNAFDANAYNTYTVTLNLKNVPDDVKLLFTATVNSSAEETRPNNNKASVEIGVSSEAKVALSGTTDQEQLFFAGPAERAFSNLGDIGRTVTHKYSLRNDGSSAVNISLHVDFPVKMGQEWILYPESLPDKPEMAKFKNLKCYISDADNKLMNALKLKRSDGSTPPESSDYWVTVPGGEGNEPSAGAIAPIIKAQDRLGRDLKVAYINCTNAYVKCIKLRCDMILDNTAEQFALVIDSYINNATLVKYFKEADFVYIVSNGSLSSLKNIQWHSKSIRTGSIRTTALPSLSLFAKERKSVPIWVIIVSVVAGLLLLAIILLILWRCGFFKRQRPEYERVATHEVVVQKGQDGIE